jgi:hypothetical protein
MSKSVNKSTPKSDITPTQGQDSLIGLFARVFWSLLGNLVLFALAMGIYKTQTIVSIIDIVFWVLAFSMIIVRYFDIKYLKGVTFEGQPATMEDWRKYVKYFLLFALGLWLIAHIVSAT